MDPITLLGLLVYSTGAFLFGASLVLWVAERRRLRRGVAPLVLTLPGISPAADATNVALSLLSVVWFAVNALLLAAPAGVGWTWWVGLGYVTLAFLYPPLIMHAVVCDEPRWASAGPAWRWAPRVMWIASASCIVVFVGGLAGWVSPPVATSQAARIALGSLFLVASAYGAAAMRRFRPPVEPVHRGRARRSQLVAFGFMGVVFAAIVLGGIGGGHAQRLLIIVAHSLPLLFFAVGTYHDSRVAFVDLLLKRGSAFVVALAVLLVFFAAVEPWLDGQALGSARAWFCAVTLLPAALLLPWLQVRLERYIDRAWLGRQHTPLSASRLFLAAIESAPDEEALRAAAEATLSRLFDTRVQVVDATSDAGPGDLNLCLKGAASHLALRAARREPGVPLLSEDVTLLSLLGELFAVMLAQTRLQSQRRAHDRQARELALQASRSELKALRAQINPHFLFNALNTIGGLIQRDPDEADRVVERLAEVFRYTLTRSDVEWVRVDEELNFVRAYLDIERARFGARLEVEVVLDPAAAACVVPTMSVQTLVENAVKHGVSQAPGAAGVRVEAGLVQGRLDVQVIDRGTDRSLRTRSDRRVSGAGHGLANIRARLAGYFGDEASLTLEQSAGNGETRARLRLPAVRVPPAAAAAATLESVT